MTVATTTNKVSYTASAAQTIFPYTYKIFADGDLDVYVDGTLKTLTTHYTVSGAGDPSGGNVTFVTPMTGGESVILVRTIDATQGVDLVENDIFPSSSVEDALDRLTMLSQQVNEISSRALTIPVSDVVATNGNIPSETLRASKFLAFDATGAPIVAAGTSASLGPVSGFIDTLLDDADAATARATLGAVGLTGTESIAGTKTFTDPITANAGFTNGIGPTYTNNIGFTATVAAKALTIALKTKALADPSAGSPVEVAFRNTTTTTGDYVVRQITSATSLVVPSGAMLGVIGAQYTHLAVFICDDGSTRQIGVCHNPSLFNESYLYTTTAMTTGSDSAGVLYTTSAMTNAAIRRIGTIEITGGAVSGEWDNAPSHVYLSCTELQSGKRVIAMADGGSSGTWVGSANFATTQNVLRGDIILLHYNATFVTGSGAFLYQLLLGNTGGGTATLTNAALQINGPAVIGAGIGGSHSFSLMLYVETPGTLVGVGCTTQALYGTAAIVLSSTIHTEIWRQH